MTKEDSSLRKAEEEVKQGILRVNNDMDFLGITSEKMYNAIVKIQSTFDEIRGVPSKTMLTYEKTKNLSTSWKLQADSIQRDFENFRSKNNAAGAAGGLAGAAIGALGPTAAMGVATTFGVASTGTAISSLSGAAATNAALAWLGGGTLATGGGGMAAGNLFLSLAGPIGWSICIASLAGAGIIFWKGKKKKTRVENIFTSITKRDVKTYCLAETEIKEKVKALMSETIQLELANQEIKTFGIDYTIMSEEQQYKLGTYVNLMLTAVDHLVRPISSLSPKIVTEDINKYIYNIHQITPFLKESDRLLVISLANFLHKIELDTEDIKIIYDCLSGNQEFLDSIGITSGQFDKEFVILAHQIDKKKYPTQRILVAR